MNAEEVRQALGLEPFDQFAKRAAEENVHRLRNWGVPDEELRKRRSGRTTAMLCEVVARISIGHPTYIEADTCFRSEFLTERARDMARRIGFSDRACESLHRPPKPARGVPRAHVVFDHSEVERREAAGLPV